MLYLFRLLFLLINIDQKTVLNWFGMEDPTNQKIHQAIGNGLNSNISNLESSTDVTLQTFRLIIEGLGNKIQNGLTLSDIETVLFFIVFIRFVILAIRYNLKTSFYITCIGIFAGYLWYRHLIDLISMYRSVLIKLPFVHSLGIDAVQMRFLNRQMALTDLRLGENSHWYNPGQIIYYALTKGIVNSDSETGLRYYIDPISMTISNLHDSSKANISQLYYKLYNSIIPKIYDICSKFWNQLSGVAAYAVITRIGKRYCPYLVRWHWTFLLMMGMVEQIFIYFIYRVYYFQTFVLIPQTDSSIDSILSVIASIVLIHIGLVIFGLFHSIWGQYFYFPFFVENTELHIGPRPKNSIYSGGYTSWQDPSERNINRVFPKLWFGWFGNSSKSKVTFINVIGKLMKKIFKKLSRQFKT
jgi:hypothetical protein